MSLNRADLIRLKITSEAVAKAAAALLKAEGRVEWVDNTTRATWNIVGATAYASITGHSLAIDDDQKFFAWLRERYPSEVVQVLHVRNPEWLKMIRNETAFQVAAGRMDAPPGTRLEEGGQFETVTVKPDALLARHVAGLAREALARGAVPDPRALWTTALTLATAPETGEPDADPSR